MKRRHRELMQRVAAAKPDMSGETDAWVRSGRARELLDDILATAEETVEPDYQVRPEGEGPPGRTGLPRWSFAAAGAVVVICVVAFLAIYVLPSLGDENRVAVQPSLTTAPGATTLPAPSTTVAAGPDVMTKGEALETLIRFAEEFPGRAPGRPVFEDSRNGILLSAAAFGLVKTAEMDEDTLDEPASRAEFAIWLVRGWPIPLRGTTVQLADLATLDGEQARAAIILVSAGIMGLSESGRFRGNDPLTPDEMAAALSQLMIVTNH